MNPSASRPVCIVTGASSGIGAATALLFAQRGHDVVINYARQSEAAERVADQCRAAGAQVLVVQADVGEDAQCRALAAQVRSTWGHADALVNSAGITTKFADLKDLDALDAHDFAAIYRVNVIGTFQMCRAVAPLMQGRPAPGIVNISSMGGRMGSGSSMAYAASKGAVNTLTLSLARALAPAIRVNAVLPGMVDGEWLRRGLGEEVFAQRRKRYESRALLADVVQPQDVARTAYWLACEARKATGQLIDVEAGFILG
ncbi:SDR family oxidoreductase [Ramlibacter sp. AW1]|uniref:SDR family oxidoreductase n=1 Tax=Ramlibacter aurantiacus TaxID=2801330 RepID=A0A936ZE62_9BURK|nr:SDR family oxidoreductase [Ramlibacter aurantiacus]MBL0419919.1 SDR family oxidoreductase [Ramlibacter aurantiacus]